MSHQIYVKGFCKNEFLYSVGTVLNASAVLTTWLVLVASPQLMKLQFSTIIIRLA